MNDQNIGQIPYKLSEKVKQAKVNPEIVIETEDNRIEK